MASGPGARVGREIVSDGHTCRGDFRSTAAGLVNGEFSRRRLPSGSLARVVGLFVLDGREAVQRAMHHAEAIVLG